ncbi:hypothetical protein AKJ16_DCAP09188, partial [Drosera capensis]
MASLATEAPTSDDDLMRWPYGCLLFTKGFNCGSECPFHHHLAVSPGVPNIPAGTEDNIQSSLESIYTPRRKSVNASLSTAIAGVGYNNTKSWPTIIVFSWASDGVPIFNALCGCY